MPAILGRLMMTGSKLRRRILDAAEIEDARLPEVFQRVAEERNSSSRGVFEVVNTNARRPPKSGSTPSGRTDRPRPAAARGRANL